MFMQPNTQNPFLTAYERLQASERAFVDGYVSELEKLSVRSGEKIMALLMRPLPANLDQRTRDMLSRALIGAAISDRVRKISEDQELSVYRTLRTLQILAYSNIGDYMTFSEDNWVQSKLHLCNPDQLEAVKSVEYEENPRTGRKIKITLHDKIAAHGRLMQYQGLLDDDGEHFRKSQSRTSRDAVELPASATVEQAADAWQRLLGE